MSPLERGAYDGALAAARARIGETGWDPLYEEGATLTLEEAIAYALAEEQAV